MSPSLEAQLSCILRWVQVKPPARTSAIVGKGTKVQYPLTVFRQASEFPLPELIAHIYHPGRGPFRNLCELATNKAIRIILEMRDAGRPRLDHTYLARRLVTEDWLLREGERLFGETLGHRPLYAFLGNFGSLVDPSRPAFLRLPLRSLGRVTFTIGDSMRVAAQGESTLLRYADLQALVSRKAPPPLSFTDADPTTDGDFVEVQLWDRHWLQAVEV